MEVYKFTNKLNNAQKWSRCFVAISMRSAKEMAKEFETCINEANGNVGWLKLTFDYDNVIIVEDNVNYEEGYIELDATKTII